MTRDCASNRLTAAFYHNTIIRKEKAYLYFIIIICILYRCARDIKWFPARMGMKIAADLRSDLQLQRTVTVSVEYDVQSIFEKHIFSHVQPFH